jgi:SAM-dependent methyltransferase
VCSNEPPLPYPDGSFGGVFAFAMLTHIRPERHREWYAELRRILRPGGRVLLAAQEPRVRAGRADEEWYMRSVRRLGVHRAIGKALGRIRSRGLQPVARARVFASSRSAGPRDTG